ISRFEWAGTTENSEPSSKARLFEPRAHCQGASKQSLNPLVGNLTFDFDWYSFQILFAGGAHRAFDFLRAFGGLVSLDLDHNFVVNDVNDPRRRAPQLILQESQRPL